MTSPQNNYSVLLIRGKTLYPRVSKTLIGGCQSSVVQRYNISLGEMIFYIFKLSNAGFARKWSVEFAACGRGSPSLTPISNKGKRLPKAGSRHELKRTGEEES